MHDSYRTYVDVAIQVPSIMVFGVHPRPLNDCRSYLQESKQLNFLQLFDYFTMPKPKVR